MNLSRISALCFAVLLLGGCGVKSVMMKTNASYGEYTHLIKAANSPAVCAYKGKIGVTFESSLGSGGITGILNKTCLDDATLSIFGAFNAIFAEIEYKNGEVSVKAADSASEENIKQLATVSIQGLISYLRYPLYMPDGNGTFYTEGDFYIYDFGYDKENVKIYFDKDFRVVRYIIENKDPLQIDYTFGKTGAVSLVKLQKDRESAVIKLLNADGWRAPDEK